MSSFFKSIRRGFLITRPVLAGLVMAAVGAEDLISKRYPRGFWHQFWTWVLFAVFAWEWINLFFEDEQSKSRTEVGAQGAALLAAMGLGVLGAYMHRSWAAPGMGLVSCVFLIAVWRWQLRRYLVASAGWLAAGFAVSLLPWSNEEKFYLVVVMGGLAIAVQGILDMPDRYRRALLMQSAEQATDK